MDKTVIDTHRTKKPAVQTSLPEVPTQVDLVKTSGRSSNNLAAWLLALLVVMLLAGAVLFVKEVHLPMREMLSSLRFQLSEIQGSHAQLAEKNIANLQTMQQLMDERDELVRQIENKKEILADIQEVKDDLSAKLADEMQRGEVIIKQSRGHLVVDLVDKILFETADAKLNQRGKRVLVQVAESFRKINSKIIQVGGHTDFVPISEKIVDRFPSNWELSTARATNVVRFLQDECNIPGERLVATGFSQYRPVADNKNKAGRKRNRRIEVILLPKYRY